MKDYKLYLHTAPNGKRYYGITKQNVIKRWNHGHGYKCNEYFTRAINKYGWDNINHEVLFDNLTESEAKELEQYMIQWYDTANSKYGYNISLGGDVSHHSDETRKKMSEAHIGLQAKENNPFYGKTHTEEARLKISESQKGNKHAVRKSIICLTTKRIFLTVKDGASYYNIGCQNICKCCKGQRNYCGKHNGQKLVWRYLNYKHNKIYRVKDGR